MDFKKWFVAERARALAMVLLTRRNDLDVKETKEETGLDFTVSIGKLENHRERRFGVFLRATMTPVTAERADRQLVPTMSSVQTPFPYPVCVFYFTVKNDQGYFTWIYEPVVTGTGQPRLKHHADSHCRELNDESLAEIILAVDKWYDAFYTTLAV